MEIKQQGQALIAVIFFIVVISLLAAVMAYLSVGDSTVTLNYRTAKQAFFLAESGLESAIYNFATTTPCGPGLVQGATALGPGSYSVVSASAIAALCRIRAFGTATATNRTLEADVSGTNFIEQFPNIGAWTLVTAGAPNNRGSSSFDPANNCPVATCPLTLASSGALEAQTNPTGSGDHYIGYQQDALSPSISTGATGITTTFTLAYRKLLPKGGNTVGRTIQISLFDTVANFEMVLWSDTTAPNVPWTQILTQNVALPANHTFDQIRLKWDLQEQKNKQIQIWFDEIRLRTSVKLTAWREIYP